MKINIKKISNCRNNPQYKSVFMLPVILLCIILCGCYSSTAVQGTPVKELIEARDRRVIPGLDQVRNKEIIAELSSIKSNKTFKELDGIPEYVIGPNDKLEINSHIGDKVTTKEVTVDSRGYITYSFIDDLLASGLTPSELDKTLTEKMSSYIKNPRIDILVKEYNSKSATVLGEFSILRATGSEDAGSGRIYLEGKTKLMDLFALAGGYTVDGDIKKVKLVRKGKTYVINLYDVIEKGDESQNVIINDGDIVDVPELGAFRERVYVMGEVNNQGIYSLKDARDLLGALAMAGDVTTLAIEENTLIVRGYSEPGKEPLVMMADVKALFRSADMGQNIVLEEGDLVYVPRMRIGDVNDWITNTMPLLNFLLYPGEFRDDYFSGDYLRINR